MKSRFFTIVTPLISLMFFLLGTVSASAAAASSYNSTELTNRLKTGAYLQKTDNLMIIVDGLGETFLGVGEPRNQKIGRSLISNIGKTIPNIPHRRMLRVFGPKAQNFEKDFSTIFGLYHIDAKGFTPIIATKTHAISDFDPLGMTFISATKDLKKLGGTHAIILISDGVNIPKSALYESAYMKKNFGGSVCYYPILIGNDPEGTKKMSTIAKVGGCGFLAQYEAVDSPQEMTDYVEKIFFAKRRLPKAEPVVAAPEAKPEAPVMEEPQSPVMTDTAEVTEIVEEPVIPEVIEEQPIEQVPALDDDIIILERQLPQDKVVTIELHVEFDLNQATLRPGYEDELKKVADFMQLYPETEALLEGHTCNLGSAEYNKQLSLRRASTVKNYLVDKFAIAADRFKVRGAGESEPIADNSTEAGREKNRRVVAVISTIVTDYVTVEQEVLKSDFLRDDFVLPPVEQIVDEMMMEEEQPASAEPTEEEAPQTQDQEPPMAPAPESGAAEPASVAPEGEDVSGMDAGVEPEAAAVETSTPPVAEEVQAAPPAQETMEEAPVEMTSDEQAAPEPAAQSAAQEATGGQEQTSGEDAQIDAVFDEGDSDEVESPATIPEPAAEEPELAAEKPEMADEDSSAVTQSAPGDATEPAEPPAVDKASSEDVVVVPPAESAFDEEKSPVQVETVEETADQEEVELPEDQEEVDMKIIGQDDSML